MNNVVITGGGTGGHLFAALAFAEFLQSNGYRPVIIGSSFGIEKDILPKYPFDFFLIDSKGIAGKRFLDKLKGTALMVKAFFYARSLLRRINPIFSIGFGGYVSFPVMLASVNYGCRTAILEQNSIPGKSNRILSHLCDITFVNFDITKKYLKNGIVVGNPTRIRFDNCARKFKEKLTIGVMGGSRGARSINDAMIELSRYPIDLRVIHQTGYHDIERVRKAYAENQKDWEVHAFIYDMENFYKEIDFIVCRAGASSLSEIACAALGSILIPYPYAIYNHQYFNAKYFLDNGAAYLIEDRNLTGKKLFSIISSLTVEKLRELSENACKLCKRNSCEKMLRVLRMVKR